MLTDKQRKELLAIARTGRIAFDAAALRLAEEIFKQHLYVLPVAEARNVIQALRELEPAIPRRYSK